MNGKFKMVSGAFVFVILSLFYFDRIPEDQSQASLLSVNYFPEKIVFSLDQSEISQEKVQELYLFSNSNMTDIRVFLTDFESPSNHEKIPRIDFVVQPSTFSMTANNASVLTIKMNLKQNYSLGTYVGRLMILGPNLTPLNIATEVIITEQTLRLDSLRAQPASIRFVFDSNNAQSASADIDILANRTLLNVTPSFSVLRNENGTALSGYTLETNYPKFHAFANNVTSIKVQMELKEDQRSHGIYHGMLILSSENSRTTIPITAIIEPPEIWYEYRPLILIIAGLVLSILLILAREGGRLKDLVLDSVRKAYHALDDAKLSKRMSTSEIQTGLNYLHSGIGRIRYRNVSSAIVDFERAKEFFDKANKDGDQFGAVAPPLLEVVEKEIAKNTAHLAVTFQGDRLYAIAFSVIVTIVILTTLQTVSNDLLVIDNLTEVIAAILFGFGAPALANQLVPLIRREK